MRNIRWLKLVVTLAALGLITATASAQAADIPVGSLSSPAPGYCSPAPQPAADHALPNRLSAGGLCSEASLAYVPTAAGWRVAGPANGGATFSLVAFVAQAATWGDAGAGHHTASAPASVAAGWLAAIASRGQLIANPAPFGAPGLTWGDAGVVRR
jgi:hypothetical protein